MALKTKLRALLDATFDTGMYTGTGRVHTATFGAAKIRRDKLWNEMEKDIDGLLEACKVAYDALDAYMSLTVSVVSQADMDLYEQLREAIAKAEGDL